MFVEYCYASFILLVIYQSGAGVDDRLGLLCGGATLDTINANMRIIPIEQDSNSKRQLCWIDNCRGVIAQLQAYLTMSTTI